MSEQPGQLLSDGIRAAKDGRMAEARALLNRVIAGDQRNEAAWLWLSAAVETDDERVRCLEHVIAINPGNEHALRGLAVLRSGQRDTARAKAEHPTPWYFSTTMLILTFLFCTPLWAILILADKRHGKATKAFAGVLCFAFVGLLGAGVLYATRGAQFMTVVRGPGEIQFGSRISESGGGLSLEGGTKHYRDGASGDEIAWIASLGGPARTTKFDLVLSMGTAADGEVVIATSPIQLANPSFDTVYGTLSPGLYFMPGSYTLRLMSGDSILAEGQFDVF